MSAEAGRAEREAGDSSVDTRVEGAHLGSDELYALVEQRLTRRRLRAVETHLDGCAECVETLAMVLRTDRPATREEQGLLAQAAERSPEDLLAELRPRIESSTPEGPGGSGLEWKPIVVATVIALVLASVGLFVYDRLWLPAASRRTASHTLEALVKLRNATGRLPLRYITAFERAGVVRSGFDTTEATEEALLSNLREAYERAPEPEATIALGLLLLDSGQLQEAERLLLEGREARPDSVDALNGLAVLYFQKAEYFPDEAYSLHQRGLALLRDAESIDPEDLRVLFNYGMFYDAMEMHVPAIRAWTRYLEADPFSQWSEVAARELARLTQPNPRPDR